MSNKVGFLQKVHFEFVGDFLKDKIRVLLEVNTNGTTDHLIDVSKHSFYLQRWIEDMTFFGWPEVSQTLKKEFLKNFGTEEILHEIFIKNFLRALPLLSGRQILGENTYTVLNQNVYYRSCIGEWYEISPEEVFLLLPELSKPVNNFLKENLDSTYTMTVYDNLFTDWQKKDWDFRLKEDLLVFKEGVNTPDEYFALSNTQIKNILKTPPSFRAIQSSHKQDIHYLERLVKVSFKIIQFVNKLRDKSVYPLYILRDGMMFAETQKIFDLLQHETTYSGQVMIGRKLLSISGQDEVYWHLVVEALYTALYTVHTDFDLFYREYTKQMRDLENTNQGLHELFMRLIPYLESHIDEALRYGLKIVIVDTGLQGSVNMLVKYLIDSYILPKTKIRNECDIFMCVVGEWFKEVYAGKFADNYYPMMRDIEIFYRSEHIYQYKSGSFMNGKLEVEMGKKEDQSRANFELIVLAVTSILMHEKGFIGNDSH